MKYGLREVTEVTEVNTEMTEKELNAAIAKLQSEYHAVADKLNAEERKAVNVKMFALQAELSALLSKGAKPCPKCETLPHGMLKRPGYEDKNGEHLPLYEVGCLTCPNGCRASTPEKAVTRWNDFVESESVKPIENVE